jgi:hypothetical protein
MLMYNRSHSSKHVLNLSGAKIWPVPMTCGDGQCAAVGHDGQPCPSCTASKPVAWWLTWGFMGAVTLPGSTR